MTEEEGVGVTYADVNGFTVAELRFPPGYVQDWFEPESAYLAVVLDGALVKTFRSRSMQLAQSDAVTMPAGELHEARFGTRGAQIVIVKAREASATATRCLNRLAGLRGPVFGWLAWRLAGELQAADAAAPIAAEGFALELLAAAGREAHPAPRSRKPPPWLGSVEELLRASTDERLGLRELSAAVGVDPAHVARAFRARHGVSVGEYARQLRLAWAAGELSRTETPLALIAAQAGFADQSHFTRLFRQHLGITPARYRRETRRDSDRTA